MANISITIPDQHLDRVMDAIAGSGGYDTNTGLTKAQFAKLEVQRMIKERVINYEQHLLREAVPEPPALEM